MKNVQTFVIFAAIVATITMYSGCQNAANSNTASGIPANQGSSNSNAAAVNTTPVATPDTQSTQITGSLATPTEAYKTAYELRKNKDVAGLKLIMTKDVQEFLTMMGEEEKKSLDDMIKEMCDQPQANKAATRNEKVKGNRAVLEYLTETGAWKTMDFEKVDGKWLMSLPAADGPEPAK